MDNKAEQIAQDLDPEFFWNSLRFATDLADQCWTWGCTVDDAMLTYCMGGPL